MIEVGQCMNCGHEFLQHPGGQCYLCDCVKWELKQQQQYKQEIKDIQKIYESLNFYYMKIVSKQSEESKYQNILKDLRDVKNRLYAVRLEIEEYFHDQ